MNMDEYFIKKAIKRACKQAIKEYMEKKRKGEDLGKPNPKYENYPKLNLKRRQEKKPKPCLSIRCNNETE